MGNLTKWSGLIQTKAA